VKFHPTEDKTVISGSTDGIINLFDVTQTTEQDAFQLSFNTNSSVVSEIINFSIPKLFYIFYYCDCLARLKIYCMLIHLKH